MEERTQGILLHTRPVGEADLIVHFYTTDYGRLTLKARGAKKSKRRFAGLLESFSRHFIAFERKRAGWPVLLRLEPVEMYTDLRNDLGAFAAASYASELVLKLTEEGDINRDIFDLLTAFVSYHTEKSLSPKSLSRFKLRLLEDLGLLPNWDNCMDCGSPYHTEEMFRFELGQGGILCRSCSHRYTRTTQPLHPNTRLMLIYLQNRQTLHVPEPLPWSEALRLLNLRFNHLLGFPPRSRGFLYQMNPALPTDSNDTT